MTDRAYLRAKRFVDVLGSAALLAGLAPVLAVTALAVRLDSAGPAIYRQERVGRYGRPFTMLKFRTMTHGADETPHRDLVAALLGNKDVTISADGASSMFKVGADPRVTRVGRLLRATSIDELPQLVNVLCGQMSLVGPRPDVPYAVEQYEAWQWRRMDVRPGLTGLWQVSGRARLSPQEMLRLDVDHVERRSFDLDLRILGRTIPAVLRRVGSE